MYPGCLWGGRENYGALYEISNQKTMGRSERELTDLVNKVALQLNDQENQVRELSLKSHRLERKTRCISPTEY